MIISVLKLAVRRTDKRARRKHGGRQGSKEQIPSNSHRIQRKWPFEDAMKESFGFEISFFKCNNLVKMKSWGLERSVRWSAGKHRWLEPNEAETQLHAATSLKGWICLSQRPIRHVREESGRAGGSWRSRD